MIALGYQAAARFSVEHHCHDIRNPETWRLYEHVPM